MFFDLFIYNQTAIKLQLSDVDKANIDGVLDLKIMSVQGTAIPNKGPGYNSKTD
jgi:hypothetical protein